MRLWFFLGVYLGSTFYLFGQNEFKKNELYHDLNFIIHLTKNNLFNEAVNESNRILNDASINPLYHDSINYILGMAFYRANRLEDARYNLLKVTDSVLFYFKARYLSVKIDIEANRFDSALTNLFHIKESEILDLQELKKFEIAGMSLLKKQYQIFDSTALNYQFKNGILNEEFQILKKYALLERNKKVKSMLLAGCLSAIVPGLGKVYAGNNGQALATLLTCGLFGAIAAENIVKQGLNSPSAIIFTSIFSLFYVGNIWGSALSVQLINTEKQFENKHNIMVGLKLPIDKFFK